MFIRRGKEFVYKLASSAADGIRAILSKSDAFQVLGMCSEEVKHISVLLVVWADNCQSLTSVKFRLVEQSGEVGIFGDKGLSPICVLLDLIGGEGDLPPWIPQCTTSLQEAMATLFTNDSGGGTVSIVKAFGVFDHHCLNIFMGIPGASSPRRDTFANTLQQYWSLHPFDQISKFNMQDNANNFDAIQSIMLQAKELDEHFHAAKPPELKNVGNTCWANAILQSLLVLPSVASAVNSVKGTPLDSLLRTLQLFFADPHSAAHHNALIQKWSLTDE
jgi:hypothetical protein